MTTIENLQSQLEELEKRIKAISNAQTLHQSLSALENYFDTIKDYLEDVEDLLEDANSDHTDITTTLTTLSTTVSGLADRITALENAETEVDLSEIENSISTLETQITNLIDGSNATVGSLESDISDLETDLGSLEDRVDDAEDDISDINTDMGTMQTSINTLTSAQSSLSSAQSSLTSTVSGLNSTVSGINSRLTTVEGNISMLTGGVNFDEYDEILNWPQNYFSHTYNIYTKPENGLLYIDFVKFTTQNFTMVDSEFTFNYEVNSTQNGSTMQIQMYVNGELQQTETVDLTTHTTSYSFLKQYFNGNRYHECRFIISTLADVAVNTLVAKVHATGATPFDTFRNIEVKCAGNKMMVIRKLTTSVRFKLYNINQINNVSFDTSDLVFYKQNTTDQKNYVNIDVVPYAYSSDGKIQEWTFGLLKTTSDNVTTIEPFSSSFSSENSFFNKTTLSYDHIAKIDGMSYGEPYFFRIEPYEENNAPQGSRLSYATYSNQTSINSITATGLSSNQYWLWLKPIEYNYFNTNSSIRSSSKIMLLGLYKDGYFYFIYDSSKDPIKVGRGDFATGYYESNGAVNIYISNLNKTTKYKFLRNSSTNEFYLFSTGTFNYSTMYEMYNGKMVVCSGTKNWRLLDTIF